MGHSLAHRAQKTTCATLRHDATAHCKASSHCGLRAAHMTTSTSCPKTYATHPHLTSVPSALSIPPLSYLRLEPFRVDIDPPHQHPVTHRTTPSKRTSLTDRCHSCTDSKPLLIPALIVWDDLTCKEIKTVSSGHLLQLGHALPYLVFLLPPFCQTSPPLSFPFSFGLAPLIIALDSSHDPARTHCSASGYSFSNIPDSSFPLTSLSGLSPM